MQKYLLKLFDMVILFYGYRKRKVKNETLVKNVLGIFKSHSQA